ncbi:peptidoglycan amidohydrolase family protein, partial [Limosilactobacillus coleohominis]|uniref:peptidoglycan amidohydrolase family protein n=1 Tax=Limosilactobacillus coleohominis TaxID=181675 RepID=UPI001D58FFFA
YYYFQPGTYQMVRNNYIPVRWPNGETTWYMFDNTGSIVTGIYRWYGSTYYFDPSTYEVAKNRWVDGVYFGNTGAMVNGYFSQRLINWFVSRIGKLTYSMYGSRTGRDGTADCSGGMTEALYEAGASRPSMIYNTESLHGYLVANGYHCVYEGTGQYTPQYGDVIIWGRRGYSAGGAGHTLVVTGSEEKQKCISVCAYTGHKPGTAVQEFGYDWYWRYDDCPYQYVYRLYNQARN